MKKLKLTIGNKIFIGFLSLILLFSINAGVIFFKSKDIDEVRQKTATIIRPSRDNVKELKSMVQKSKNWITNWVYLQTNTKDKENLRNLHTYEYPAIREKINELIPYWSKEDSAGFKMEAIMKDFEDLIKIHKTDIMSELVTFENYEDPFTKLMAEDKIEAEILPKTDAIIERLKDVDALMEDYSQRGDRKLEESSKSLRELTLLLGSLIIFIGVVEGIFMSRSITKPILFIKEIVQQLGRGELPEDKDRRFSNDEIGEMAVATEKLVNGLKSTTMFAENIGNGNYDSVFEPLSEQDVLGNALLEMRKNLQAVSEEDKKRNWATEGLAKFGDLLRRNNDNIERLSDEIIVNLIKYLDANQGGLFVVENQGNESYMGLVSCYAWDKKKYLEQKIVKGDGLIGQCWLEMDTIYITDVPDDYVTITSGLGDANPTSILIVPLKVNDEIFGAVEIASFNEIKDYEVDFVEKIAESIASTISTVKINARTQKLLEESTQLTEQMRSQEEEMRQNMEELQATQEEMQRSQNESQGTLEAINHALGKVDLSPDGRILAANQNFLNMLGYSRNEIVDKPYKMLVDEEARISQEYENLWEALRNGRIQDGEFQRKSKSGKLVWLKGNYTPIKNNRGEVEKIVKLVYNISEYKALLES